MSKNKPVAAGLLLSGDKRSRRPFIFIKHQQGLGKTKKNNVANLFLTKAIKAIFHSLKPGNVFKQVPKTGKIPQLKAFLTRSFFLFSFL